MAKNPAIAVETGSISSRGRPAGVPQRIVIIPEFARENSAISIGSVGVFRNKKGFRNNIFLFRIRNKKIFRTVEGDQGLVVEAASAAAQRGQGATVVEVPGDVDEDRVEVFPAAPGRGRFP